MKHLTLASYTIGATSTKKSGPVKGRSHHINTGLQAILLNKRLVIETWLLVLDAKLAVDSSNDALNLTHSEHAAKECVTRVVAMVALVEHATWLINESHAMIDTHWETTARVALALLLSLLEDAAELDEVATTAQVRSLGEVAIREDVARAEVNEVGAIGKLVGHSHTVVVLAGRE